MFHSLYVDLNSYFASVEQQLRPELRNKAIGVLPVMADTTCCIAASIDAKRFGIKTGTPMTGGGITTAGDLVFIGATVDGYFRAIDARNGRELWSTKLEVPAHSVPSTYMGRDGKQYVVVPVGGGGFLRTPTSDAVVAFRLP